MYENPDRPDRPERLEAHEHARVLLPGHVHGQHYPEPSISVPGDKTQNLTAGMVYNAIVRWWRAALPAGLLLALAGAGIVWLAFVPKYESTATLEIRENTPYIVYNREEDQSRKFVTTQVQLIRQRIILSDALAGLEGSSELARHKDPIEWVRSQLQVNSVGNSELFAVSYQGRTPTGPSRLSTRSSPPTWITCANRTISRPAEFWICCAWNAMPAHGLSIGCANRCVTSPNS